MKISASLFAVNNNFIDYALQLKKAGVHSLHLDYLEGSNAPIRLEDLESIGKSVNMPLDVHLIRSIVSQSDIKHLNDSKVKYLSIQYEQLHDKNNLSILSSFNGNGGVAITTLTSIDVISAYQKYIKFVMVMCSQPGVSGASFDYSNIDRIREIRCKYPNLAIHVDGGIGADNVLYMKELKVDLLVSGSYIANAKELHSSVFRLKFAGDKSLQVNNIMLGRASLPTVNKNTNFIDVLDAITEYRLGIAFVVDSNSILLGIITDGDIRRGFLNYGKDIFDKKADELKNNDPFYVKKDEYISILMSKLSKTRKGISVIPVLSDDHELIGAIDFIS